MGLPHKFLGTDETEVLHLRTHAKALIAPAVVFLLSATAAGFLVALTPPEWQPAAGIVEFVLVVLVFLTWVVWPFLRWLTTTYTLTTRRIISRRGIINQTGHDLHDEEEQRQSAQVVGPGKAVDRHFLLLHHGVEVHLLHRKPFPDPGLDSSRSLARLHRVLLFSPGITPLRVE